MNDKLKTGIYRLLNALPEGATAASVNWMDDAGNYGISASLVNGQWQIWVSHYLTPSTTATTQSDVAAA